MLKKDVTKKMLVEIAAVLNKVMAYESPIATGRKVLRKDLYDEVADSAQDIEPADLENKAFTPDIVKWLKVMGWESPAEKVEKSDEVESKPTETEDAPELKKEPKKEKKAPAKKAPAKKAPAKADPDTKKDEFGFGIGTKRNLFVESIRENPMTMTEIKKEDWNDSGQSFYQAWGVIKTSGKGKTDGKKMSI